MRNRKLIDDKGTVLAVIPNPFTIDDDSETIDRVWDEITAKFPTAVYAAPTDDKATPGPADPA